MAIHPRRSKSPLIMMLASNGIDVNPATKWNAQGIYVVMTDFSERLRKISKSFSKSFENTSKLLRILKINWFHQISGNVDESTSLRRTIQGIHSRRRQTKDSTSRRCYYQGKHQKVIVVLITRLILGSGHNMLHLRLRSY